MEKKFSGRGAFVLVLIVSIALILIGGRNVWRSFQKFDENVLAEKDSQFYSLIRSDDINIENSISSFVRETETFLSRNSVNNALSKWKEGEGAGDLKDVLGENTLRVNPIYADLLAIRKDKISCSATGNTKYTFVTGSDLAGFSILKDESGKYYMAYEYEVSDSIRFASLIDLAALYNTTIGFTQDRQVLLLDSGRSVLMTAIAGRTIVMASGDEAGGDLAETKEFIMECQAGSRTEGKTLEMSEDDGSSYAARMVVLPSGSTVNGEFAIGTIANYDEAIAPSIKVAEQMLLYGGLALLGVIALILMLIYMNRANVTSSNELRALKKKNEAMEEINQKMQALTHHQRLEKN